MNKKIAAVCIITNKNGELLLLNRNHSPFGWCLPGGKIDISTESIVEGIKREVAEETGIRFDIKKFEFVKEDVSINGLNIHVYKLLNNVTDSIKISKEHSGYMFTSNITESIGLAGNTLSFLSDFVFEETKLGFRSKLPFGKYKGHLVEDVMACNPGYLTWLHNSTSAKLQLEVLRKIKKDQEDIENQENADEWRRIDQENNERRCKENLERAVDTPWGKAVDNYDGNHTLIDSVGQSTGEIVNWYYGWNKGWWSDDV